MTVTDNLKNDKQRTYTFELLRRFKTEEQTTAQRIREERELPLEIASTLDEVTKHQHCCIHTIKSEYPI